MHFKFISEADDHFIHRQYTGYPSLKLLLTPSPTFPPLLLTLSPTSPPNKKSS